MNDREHDIICKMLEEDASNIEIDNDFKQNLKKRIMEKALKEKQNRNKYNKYYKHLKIASALIAVSLIGSAATMGIANNGDIGKNIANSNNVNTIEKPPKNVAEISKEDNKNGIIENKKDKSSNSVQIKQEKNKEKVQKQNVSPKPNTDKNKPNKKDDNNIKEPNKKVDIEEEQNFNKIVIDNTLDYGNETNSIIKNCHIKNISIQKANETNKAVDKTAYIQRKNSQVLLYDTRNTSRYVFSRDELSETVKQEFDKIFAKDSNLNLISLSANKEETELSIIAQNNKEEYEIINISIEKNK